MDGTWNIRSHLEALTKLRVDHDDNNPENTPSLPANKIDGLLLRRSEALYIADKLDAEWGKLQEHCRSLERTLRAMNNDRMGKFSRLRKENKELRRDESNVGQALSELMKNMLMRCPMPERIYIHEHVSPSGSREWRISYAKPEPETK